MSLKRLGKALRLTSARCAPAAVDWREWDFSEVPDDQVELCHEYEYGRHSEQVKAAVAKFRRQHGNVAIEECLDINDPGTVLGEEQLPPVACVRPSFPKDPFQSINANERQRIADMLRTDGDRYLLVEGSFRKLLSIYPNLQNEYGSFRDGETTYVVMSVDWRMNPTEILRRFEEWLTKRRPKEVRKRDRTRGAGAPVRKSRAELKALGAWRLLQKMDSGDAWEATKERLKKRGLYSDEPAAWSRARATAERLLAING